MTTINSSFLPKTNKSKTLKIGIIGCGRAAELIYLPALAKFSNVKIIGVVDPIELRRKLLSAKNNNCASYSSLEDKFIAEIDAAIITTPPDTHIALASILLKNDKYVLVEKPLALSMDCIKELIEIELSSKASLMMGFNHRFWQPAVMLRDSLLNEKKINTARIIFTGDYSKWNPVSFKSDALYDLGPHVFDLIRFIFNKEMVSITVDSSIKNIFILKVRITGDVFIHCQIAHSDKTIKLINVKSESKNYSIMSGSERINPGFIPIRKILDIHDRIKRKILVRTSPIKKSYLLQLERFFDMVINSKKQAVSGIEDGISAIRAVEAVLLSIKNNGKEVFIDEI